MFFGESQIESATEYNPYFSGIPHYIFLNNPEIMVSLCLSLLLNTGMAYMSISYVSIMSEYIKQDF